MKRYLIFGVICPFFGGLLMLFATTVASGYWTDTNWSEIGKFLGAFKPGNRSPDLRGLYLAGGAAHPGPGMPMVLMSGWIAADALDKDGVGAQICVSNREEMVTA